MGHCSSTIRYHASQMPYNGFIISLLQTGTELDCQRFNEQNQSWPALPFHKYAPIMFTGKADAVCSLWSRWYCYKITFDFLDFNWINSFLFELIESIHRLIPIDEHCIDLLLYNQSFCDVKRIIKYNKKIYQGRRDVITWAIFFY